MLTMGIEKRAGRGFRRSDGGWASERPAGRSGWQARARAHGDGPQALARAREGCVCGLDSSASECLVARGSVTEREFVLRTDGVPPMRLVGWGDSSTGCVRPDRVAVGLGARLSSTQRAGSALGVPATGWPHRSSMKVSLETGSSGRGSSMTEGRVIAVPCPCEPGESSVPLRPAVGGRARRAGVRGEPRDRRSYTRGCSGGRGRGALALWPRPALRADGGGAWRSPGRDLNAWERRARRPRGGNLEQRCANRW
jgi:hypothetical protein